jgi:hypothetical protein
MGWFDEVLAAADRPDLDLKHGDDAEDYPLKKLGDRSKTSSAQSTSSINRRMA